MVIQFPCSRCKTPLSAAEDAVGLPVTCSECGEVTQVPAPSLPSTSLLRKKPAMQYHVKISQEYTPAISLKQIESQTGWAIIVTICFMPLAIVGMIFGSMAKAEFQDGNYCNAERYYKRARYWTTAALGLWGIIFLSIVFMVVIPAIKNLPQ